MTRAGQGRELDRVTDRTRATRIALLATLFLGWAFLPVMRYPIHPDMLGTIGTALPGADLVTKAAILPLALLMKAKTGASGPMVPDAH